jgi:type VI secretion system protein ImpL
VLDVLRRRARSTMNPLLRRLLGPALLGTLGVLSLSILVWWAGPLLAFGDARPLASVLVRVLVIALLWLGWLGRLGWAAWKRRRTNAALLQGLSAGPSASEREAKLLAERFDTALQRLKAQRGGGRLAALAGGGQYLYELPWYVFVGAPGSGKTTALMNAGLQFLLGDANKGAVAGVGGTRHCEWWFTADAVLIDTAGRYATQDSDREVDASAWDRFLALLKKTRPRQPINGVLLTVNVQDLLQQGGAERAAHAAQLRARLQELQTKLGVRAPVYVLVTKADLIGGFNESFLSLGKEERDQVWGWTLPIEANPTGADAADPLADFGTHFQALQKRLIEQLPDRLETERDVMRRAAVFAFPQEFAALQSVLGDFLRQVFSGGGAVEHAPRLRGVYFTSGTQEGSPIDRVMGALGRSFGIPSRSAAVQPGGGKSFFLHRLLRDVVFAERGLGLTNPAAERRRRALRLGAMATMGVAALAVVLGWALSRAHNLDHAAQVAQRLPALSQAVQTLPPYAPGGSADVRPLIGPLAQLRDAARIEGFALDDPPLLHGLGLYQGDKLDAAAQIAYRRALQNSLLPRVVQRLEERLRAAHRDDLDRAYESLKAYQMLFAPEHFDAAALQAWVGVDWDDNLGDLTPTQRSDLEGHLQALLAMGAPARVPVRDERLVTEVRDMLAALPLDFRIYNRVRLQIGAAAGVPEISVAGAVGPAALQVFERASGQPLTQGVNGLFTREGYRRLLVPAVDRAAPQLLAEEGWVLGVPADAARQRDPAVAAATAERARQLYYADYIKAWESYLADVRLVPLSDPARAMAVARALGAVDSPLSAWLRTAAQETQLSQAPPAAGGAGGATGAAAALQAEAARRTGAGTAAGGAVAVDRHFAELHRLFEGEPAPIAQTQQLFADLHTHLVAVESAKASGSPPPPPAAASAARVAASGQPAAVRAAIEQVADAAVSQGRGAEREGLSAELRPITEFCNRAITGRYPFASGARADVLPEDFGQLFGAGGQFDGFFQRRLAPLVDTSGRTWSYRPMGDGTRPATPAALADFQRAQRIRDAFFRAGGTQPALRIEMRLTEIEPSLRELVLDLDGQVQRLSTGGPSVSIAWPPPRVASVIRLSTGLGDAGPLAIFEGPWALFRLFDRFEVQAGDVPERFSVVMNLDGRRARLEVFSSSVFNPFRMPEMRQFRCPAAL